jgi:drug/metabolite transporter (DMT)-like permease
MLVTGLCFTCVNVIVKHVGQTVPPAEAVFLRYLTGLVFVLPMLPAVLRAGFAPGLSLRFGLRGVAHTAGALLWFTAMASIPMAEVTAMGYLQPVAITIGAALFLGERLALRRILAIGCAILGALIVLRPGFREIETGHLAMIFSAPAFAASYLLAKRLTGEASPAAVVAWMSVSVTVCLAPFAWAVWVPIGWGEVGWLFLTAAFATTAHYTMMLAFRAAPITVTQPVTFLQLVWSVTFGALLFSEPADGYVILGGAVILGAVVFIAWREAVLKRRPPDPKPAAPSP